MLEDHERAALAAEIGKRIVSDSTLLDGLVADLRTWNIKGATRQIRPYSSTALAIVSSDAGNLRLRFDPFEHQVIRVVDSDGQTLALRPITVTSDLEELFREDTEPDKDGVISEIGILVRDLRRATGDPITSFADLCPSINVTDLKHPEQNTGWVMSYRDLWEWAVLYERLMYATFAQSTLVVRDGLLRTKLFADTKGKSNYFRVMGDLLAERFRILKQQQKKDVYLVGLAKHSQVIDLYRLAWAMEDIFPAGSPYYVPIPREMEKRAYKFPEFARGRERLNRGLDGLCASRDPTTGVLGSLGIRPDAEGGTEDSKFVFGTMFLTRLAPELALPTWAVDVFDDQAHEADRILGHLYMDSMNGFPVPSYPQSIQRAHEAAKLTDFDAMALNEIIMTGIRRMVGNETIIDRLQLAGDMASRRY